MEKPESPSQKPGRGDERKEKPWITSDQINLILAIACSILIIVAFQYFYEPPKQDRLKAQQGPTLEDRIDELTSSLRTAASAISEIESEVSQRRQLVIDLKRDAETAQRLAKISTDEAQAVAQTLRDELEKTDAFWPAVLQNAFFMLFGVGLNELLHRLRSRRENKNNLSQTGAQD